MKRVGDYEIVRKLGEGGMGSVFLARSKDGVPVVLKTPHQPTAELVGRMEDEARTGFRLRHRHIVRTLDFFQSEGRPVLVIEWIDGASLKELRDEHGRLPPASVARIGEQISDALATIHHLKDDVTGQELRMLHRDVTPGNIVVSRDGDAKLIDLGIARSVESQSQKTAAGILRGTFRYLSPDLFAGAPYSWMTDLWALGVTLFEAALGRRAIEGDNARVFNAVAKGRLTELRAGEELHPMLKMLFDGLLAPDPKMRRFKDPEEVLHAFRVVRGRLGDGEQDTRAVMARVADRSIAAPSPASAAPTEPSSLAPPRSATPAAPTPAAPTPSSSPPRPSPPASIPFDIDDAEPTIVTRSGPAAVPVPRPVAAQSIAGAVDAALRAESTIADVDGNTTELPRAALAAVDASRPQPPTPSSKDAPPTVSMTAWRPPPLETTASPAVRAATVTKTTNVLAPAEPEPTTTPTLRRRAPDDNAGWTRARAGGLLADPPKKGRRVSAATSPTIPTIPVFVEPAIPATGEDPLGARATLVASIHGITRDGDTPTRDVAGEDVDDDGSGGDAS